jgi:hypothetical protein
MNKRSVIGKQRGKVKKARMRHFILYRHGFLNKFSISAPKKKKKSPGEMNEHVKTGATEERRRMLVWSQQSGAQAWLFLFLTCTKTELTLYGS